MKLTRKSCQHEDSSDASVLNIGQRTLILAGPISGTTVGEFLAEFSILDRTKGQITLKLYSEGGDTRAGFAIYDAISLAKNKTTIEAYGQVSSIGALVFLAGDRRFMSPECRFMVHRGNSNFGDTELGLLKKLVEEELTLDRQYCMAISGATGFDLKTVTDLVAAETYFGVQQAIAYGIAHGIIGEEK